VEEVFMSKDLIIGQIQRRASIEHVGDFEKAAREYFRDHPEYYKEYTEEVSRVNKQVSKDREKVRAAVNYRIEWVAGRDKLDLDNPADWAVAAGKVFAEDPELYKRHVAANTVHVGKISVTD
jgi:hypothetical protein